LVQAFPPREQSWSQRRFLQSFYGETAVAVELHGYPLSRILLRLFLSPLIYLPQSTGFVFIVDDWMKLSTELDARIASWQERKRPRQRLPGM
jgi:extradiol dioxygenase family protein